jgi:hypothetical protein
MDDRRKEFTVGRFTKSDYYFMWPFPKSVERMLARAEQRIRAGELTEVQKATKEFLFAHGLIGGS